MNACTIVPVQQPAVEPLPEQPVPEQPVPEHKVPLPILNAVEIFLNQN